MVWHIKLGFEFQKIHMRFKQVKNSLNEAENPFWKRVLRVPGFGPQAAEIRKREKWSLELQMESVR